MKRVINDKRGLSTIVVTLILVVLSLVAVGVVWAVISNLLKTGEQQSNFQFGTLFLNLKIDKVLVDTNGNLLVTVSRGSGQGDLKEIDFIVSDGKNSQVVKRPTTLSELGTSTFTLMPSDLTGVSGKMQIDVAPVINSGGQNQVGSKVDSKKLDYSSCLGILNTGQSQGDGTYWINPDGTPIQVYCDMTTDGGGWTRCMKMIAGDTSKCNTDSRWQDCIKIGGNNPGQIMSKWFNVGATSTEGATPVSVVKFSTGPAPYNTIKGMFSFPGTSDGWKISDSQAFNLQVISGTSYGNHLWWDWGGTLQRKANYCIGGTPNHQACVHEGTDHGACGNIYHDVGGWMSSGSAQELYIKT